MRSFSKKFLFNSPVEDIYACLTNADTIALWSGYDAVMPEEPGGEFSWFEGDISGRLIDVKPNRYVEYEWDFGDEHPVSPVRIMLSEKGGVTELSLEQKNIPEEDYMNITTGWEEMVMEAISSFLNPNF